MSGLLGYSPSEARLRRLAKAQGFELDKICACEQPDERIVRLIEGSESVWVPPLICVRCKRRTRHGQLGFDWMEDG